MGTKSHWSPDADFSACSFFIRRMDTVGFIKPAEAPVARLPLVGFIYVTSGEVLLDVDGTRHLPSEKRCKDNPNSIHYRPKISRCL